MNQVHFKRSLYCYTKITKTCHSKSKFIGLNRAKKILIAYIIFGKVEIKVSMGKCEN